MRFNPDEYVSVAERIEKFYSKFPEGRILTAIVEQDAERGYVIFRAEVYRGTLADMTVEQPAATGHASELKGGNGANSTSHIENAETSAIGRALANLGFEVKRQGGGNGSRGGAREARRAEPQGAQAQPANGAASLEERKAEAAHIVAAGGVEEMVAGEHWKVKAAGPGGRPVNYPVTRKPGDNFAACACPDYRAHADAGDAGYKCVHKLAVVEFTGAKKA